jgi:hypothetical protein
VTRCSIAVGLAGVLALELLPLEIDAGLEQVERDQEALAHELLRHAAPSPARFRGRSPSS